MLVVLQNITQKVYKPRPWTLGVPRQTTISADGRHKLLGAINSVKNAIKSILGGVSVQNWTLRTYSHGLLLTYGY